MITECIYPDNSDSILSFLIVNFLLFSQSDYDHYVIALVYNYYMYLLLLPYMYHEVNKELN